MQLSKRLNIGGVPEHFNLPWHLAIENGSFEKAEIDVSWQNCEGGTGEMTQALQEGTLDVAVLLTEGIIKAIHKGNPSRILQVYVQSPLRWGIHVAAGSVYQDVIELENKKAAISRFGSGSHLMAYVHANNNNWDLDSQEFNVVNSLQGGREALLNGTVDYFLWEKFTTKPYVDKGEFRILGECPTPWPCFVIAVREELLLTHPDILEKMLDTINASSLELKNNPNAVELVSNRYQLKKEDVKQWFSETQWSDTKSIDLNTMKKVQDRLLSLNMIDQPMSPSAFCTSLSKESIL